MLRQKKGIRLSQKKKKNNLSLLYGGCKQVKAKKRGIWSSGNFMDYPADIKKATFPQAELTYTRIASHHPGSLLSHKKALSLRPSARYIFLSLA